MPSVNSGLSFIYRDPFHTGYYLCTTAISLITNGTLLLVLHKTRSNDVGSYRYLLMVFAVCDVLTSIFHLIVRPIAHMTPMGFWFFASDTDKWTWSGEDHIVSGAQFSVIVVIIFIATFYQTFLILAYHFVYRVIVLSMHRLVLFFSSWSLRQWVSLGAAINVVYTSLFVVIANSYTSDAFLRSQFPREVKEIYGMDLSSPLVGSFAVLYRATNARHEVVAHSKALFAMVILLVIFLGTAAVIVVCIFAIGRAIGGSIHMNERTRRMQRQLFKALLVQTCIPVVFSYVPLASLLLVPMTGFNGGDIGNILMMTTAIFPAVDAILVIGFVSKFRATFVGFFCRSISGRSTTTTVSIHSSKN